MMKWEKLHINLNHWQDDGSYATSATTGHFPSEGESICIWMSSFEALGSLCATLQIRSWLQILHQFVVPMSSVLTSSRCWARQCFARWWRMPFCKLSKRCLRLDPYVLSEEHSILSTVYQMSQVLMPARSIYGSMPCRHGVPPRHCRGRGPCASHLIGSGQQWST